MTGHSVIAAHDVQRRFPGKHVLRGVDLEIPQGSVVGLLGKNAAGKSTLIKCILGLLRIDGGTMQVFGEDAWWLSAESKARLGYVPQEVKLYPWIPGDASCWVDRFSRLCGCTPRTGRFGRG